MSEFTVMDENHFTITLQDTTIMDFSITTHSDENYAQAKGMANYFSQAPLVNQQVKEAALIQMQLFNCIIGIQFLVDDNEERTKRLINSIYEIAQELTAFILHPTMALYRPDGKLVISIDGKSDLEEFYPQANSSLLDKDIEESPADIERKIGLLPFAGKRRFPTLSICGQLFMKRNVRFLKKRILFVGWLVFLQRQFARKSLFMIRLKIVKKKQEK